MYNFGVSKVVGCGCGDTRIWMEYAFEAQEAIDIAEIYILDLVDDE